MTHTSETYDGDLTGVDGPGRRPTGGEAGRVDADRGAAGGHSGHRGADRGAAGGHPGPAEADHGGAGRSGRGEAGLGRTDGLSDRIGGPGPAPGSGGPGPASAPGHPVSLEGSAPVSNHPLPSEGTGNSARTDARPAPVPTPNLADPQATEPASPGNAEHSQTPTPGNAEHSRASATVGAVEPRGRGPAVSSEGLPGWLVPVARAAETVAPEQMSRFLPPESGDGRQSAVLVLFGEGPRGPELLLMERASQLRSHGGQPSFPGGALDPEDGDPATTGPLRAALREAEEETGLDPAGVQLFGVLPRLYIPVSGFVVTPVLGWWREPTPVRAVDSGETARVFTVPVADLTDPANRATAVHPRGHAGPAFLVESALVWGFTAGVIDRIVHYAGWERPWDRAKRVPLDWHA